MSRRTIRLFGVAIDCDTELWAPATDEPPSLTITESRLPFPDAPSLLQMRLRLPEGPVEYGVSRADHRITLRFRSMADFLVGPDRIEYHRHRALTDHSLAWLLLGSVLGLWLDYSGWPVLHAAVVQCGSGAVAFVGDSGAGKTTVAAAFLKNGHRVIGDDHLVLGRAASSFTARPALPWLKVRPDVSHYLGLRHEDLPLLNPRILKRRLDLGPTQRVLAPLELSRVFILHRHQSAMKESFRPIESKHAVMQLVRHSYSPRTVEAVGLQPMRLPILADLAATLGVWRLDYAHGLDQLDRLVGAVQANLDAGW